MSWGMVAVAAATVVGGVVSANAQENAAEDASNAQAAASRMGIEETRRQFDTVQRLLAPYSTGGANAFGSQQALLGLAGATAQQKAIQGIAQGPQMQALVQQGENAILQNASATGGLRGGNTQAALAQFRPQMLSQLLQQQFQNLGGISGLGQASAAGQAAAAQQTGQSISGLLGQQGAAQAGNALAHGQAQANLYNGIGSAIGQGVGMYMQRGAI
jgi:hypothetical protein